MGKRFLYIIAFILLLAAGALSAQERVYVATDKNGYVAGEDVWCSVYCIDEATGRYSAMSSVAYLEFHSMNGLEDRIKVSLIAGRGCGRLQIPLDFATGNYVIVAYTKKDGGDSKGAFDGKIVTVFNTVTSERVNGGVKVVSQIEDQRVKAQVEEGDIRIEAGSADNGILPVKIYNEGSSPVSLNVSVYCWDDLEKHALRYAADRPLLQRKGDFNATGVVEYAGETVTVKVEPVNNVKDWYKGCYVYMSAKGNEDDLYVSRIDSLGYVTFYTNNMSGDKDVMIEVVDNVVASARIRDDVDSAALYIATVIGQDNNHIPGEIPQLEIAPQLRENLQRRGMWMQISRRFAADSLYNLMPMRTASYLGAARPLRYKLDDYTRFPTVEDVVREYVSNLRIRQADGARGFKVVNTAELDHSWVSKGLALALLDGVPVRDHNRIINMDPMLIEEIVVYPCQFVLNHFVFDGVVKFNTYKGDLGGLDMGRNFSVHPYKGVQYPLALLGDGIRDNAKYPNYNTTLYWNPILELKDGNVFEFSAPLPKYKGKFKIVAEGIDSKGNGIFREALVSIE